MQPHPHKIEIDGATIEVYVAPPEAGDSPTAKISAIIEIHPLVDSDEMSRIFGEAYLVDVPGTHSFHKVKWTALAEPFRLHLRLKTACPSREEVVVFGTQIVCDILGRFRAQRARRESALRARELALHDAGW